MMRRGELCKRPYRKALEQPNVDGIREGCWWWGWPWKIASYTIMRATITYSQSLSKHTLCVSNFCGIALKWYGWEKLIQKWIPLLACQVGWKMYRMPFLRQIIISRCARQLARWYCKLKSSAQAPNGTFKASWAYTLLSQKYTCFYLIRLVMYCRKVE